MDEGYGGYEIIVIIYLHSLLYLYKFSCAMLPTYIPSRYLLSILAL